MTLIALPLPLRRSFGTGITFSQKDIARSMNADFSNLFRRTSGYNFTAQMSSARSHINQVIEAIIVSSSCSTTINVLPKSRIFSMSQSSGRYLVDANQLMVHLKCKERLISLINLCC